MKSIVAVDKNWGIGKNNDLLFKLPLDLKQYKEKTWGKTCVMGANTYDSLPQVALKGRNNIVLDHTGKPHENAKTFSTLEDLLKEIATYPQDEVMVIGGASIYKLLLDYCSHAYVTKVNADGEATVFYPNLDENENWQLVSTSEVVIDNGYETSYNVYKKVK